MSVKAEVVPPRGDKVANNTQPHVDYPQVVGLVDQRPPEPSHPSGPGSGRFNRRLESSGPLPSGGSTSTRTGRWTIGGNWADQPLLGSLQPGVFRRIILLPKTLVQGRKVSVADQTRLGHLEPKGFGHLTLRLYLNPDLVKEPLGKSRRWRRGWRS